MWWAVLYEPMALQFGDWDAGGTAGTGEECMYAVSCIILSVTINIIPVHVLLLLTWPFKKRCCSCVSCLFVFENKRFAAVVVQPMTTDRPI
jgi:hypothetical protein